MKDQVMNLNKKQIAILVENIKIAILTKSKEKT